MSHTHINTLAYHRNRNGNKNTKTFTHGNMTCASAKVTGTARHRHNTTLTCMHVWNSTTEKRTHSGYLLLVHSLGVVVACHVLSFVTIPFRWTHGLMQVQQNTLTNTQQQQQQQVQPQRHNTTTTSAANTTTHNRTTQPTRSYHLQSEQKRMGRHAPRGGILPCASRVRCYLMWCRLGDCCVVWCYVCCVR